MNTFTLSLTLALLLACSAVTPVAHADSGFSIKASAANVPISPRAPNRNAIRLPSITFAFDIDTACQDNWVADSLSISVADTRLTLDAQQIDAGPLASIELHIPAKQIAPLALQGFCVQESASSGRQQSDQQLIVHDVLSAHASLLCAGDNEQKMTYLSRPLDILLICERPEEDEAVEISE